MKNMWSTRPWILIAVACCLCITVAAATTLEPVTNTNNTLALNESIPAGEENDISRNQMGTFHLIVNYVLLFISGTIAAAAGVGGGAIYTPLIIILFDLLYEAVPLSKAAVFGCSLSFFAGNILTAHPAYLGFDHRFAFDVVMVMEPATLLGTVFGVLVSRMMPYWIITIIMVTLLSFSARKTFLKGKRLQKKEQEPEASEFLLGATNKNNLTQSGYGTVSDTVADKLVVAAMCEGYEEWIGYRCIISVGVVYVTILISSILTDENSPVGIQCGSLIYWIVIAVSSIVCILVSMANIWYLLKRRSKFESLLKSRKQRNPDFTDIRDRDIAVVWTAKNSLLYPLLCVVAGFLSSLVGVGGSTIKTPILLQMGLHPALAKSTGQLMLLSTVSMSLFQFWFNGMLPAWYAVTFFISGIFSGIVGKYSVDRYVEHKGRPSIIVFLLAWYIVFAMLVMAGIGILLVVGQYFGPTSDNYKNRAEQLWFRDMCNSLPPDLGAIKWLFS